MRCAILRLTSLGVLPAEPHMARDSVETHATVPREAEDHPPPQASKTSGRKEAPRAATCAAVLEGVLARLDFVKHIGYGGVGSGEEGGAEDGGNREIPGLGEARHATEDPYVSRAATSGDVREQVRGSGQGRGHRGQEAPGPPPEPDQPELPASPIR